MDMFSRLDEAVAAELFLKHKKVFQSLDEYMDLLKIDPTFEEVGDFDEQGRGKFTNWLIAEYGKLPAADRKNLLDEDADQVTQGLQLFMKLSRNSEGKDFLASVFTDSPKKNIADIQEYSLADIRLLFSRADEAEGQDTKLDRRIEVLFNGEKLLMLSPLTHEAARKYGTGTNWCTAVSNPYHYNYYKDKGLIIIINKDNPSQKWQLTEKEGEVRNNRDVSISALQLIKTVAEQGEQFELEIDRIAEILGMELDVPGWQRSDLVLDDQEKMLVAELQTKSLSALRNATAHGPGLGTVSLLASLIMSGHDVLAERLVEEFGLTTRPEDVIKLRRYEWSQKHVSSLLEHLSAEGLVRVLQETSQQRLLGSIDPPRVLQLFRLAGERLSLPDRIDLLPHHFDPSSLFSSPFIDDLLHFRKAKADDLLCDYLTAFFPEIFAKKARMEEAYYFGSGAEEEREELLKNAFARMKSLRGRDEVFVCNYLYEALRRHTASFPKTMSWLKERLDLRVDALEEAPLFKKFFGMGKDTPSYKKAVGELGGGIEVEDADARARFLSALTDMWATLDWQEISKNVGQRISDDLALALRGDDAISPLLPIFEWMKRGYAGVSPREAGWPTWLLRNTIYCLALDGEEFDRFHLARSRKWIEDQPEIVQRWLDEIAKIAKQNGIIQSLIPKEIADQLDATIALVQSITAEMQAIADKSKEEIQLFLMRDVRDAFPALQKNKMCQNYIQNVHRVGNLLSCPSKPGSVWYFPMERLGDSSPYSCIDTFPTPRGRLKVAAVWNAVLVSNNRPDYPTQRELIARTPIWLHIQVDEETKELLIDLFNEFAEAFETLWMEAGGDEFKQKYFKQALRKDRQKDLRLPQGEEYATSWYANSVLNMFRPFLDGSGSFHSLY